MKKKFDSLLVKFALSFLVFAIITLTASGVSIYLNQTALYKEQCELNVKRIAEHLEHLMSAEGEDFIVMQDYYMKNHNRMMIPHDFSGDYHPDKLKFEQMFAEAYPDKIFKIDVTFDELPDELKMAYVLYKYEYWLNVYEKAKIDFGLEWLYYMVPTQEPFHMVYMIDILREKKVMNGVECIALGGDVYEPLEEHQKMWAAWNSGQTPEGYDEYDNEYGKTYAYYSPLYVNNRKMGVVGIDITIASVNEGILMSALRQTAGLGLVLALCVFMLLLFVGRGHIAKLKHIETIVREYAMSKNPAIAKELESISRDGDEVCSLAAQISAMIVELDNYMKELVATSRELIDTKKQAQAMGELAHKDALTGLRNKAAYDNEMRRIEWDLADGYTEFGIAMIDLNFLKRTNDTYGHEQGNIAIKRLCRLVCNVFDHSPVFRIGGDEFVVILENESYHNADKLVDEFNSRVTDMMNDDTLEPWEKLSAAIGIALYDPLKDSSAANVFKRADKAMYNRKKTMKAIRQD